MKRYPSEIKLLDKRAIAFCSQGNYQDAIDDYTEIIRLEPKNASTYNDRGDTYNKIGEYDKALADANKAIENQAKRIRRFRIIRQHCAWILILTG